MQNDILARFHINCKENFQFISPFFTYFSVLGTYWGKTTRFCVWAREETPIMLTIRTDLAMEAHQLWREKAGETTKQIGRAHV